jgi:uncharacterized membrane protein (UPF0127 family)
MEVEVATDFKKGLGYRKHIAKPMLFIFDKPEIRSMCMRGMLVPIDIVWISDQNKIVKVYHNVSHLDKKAVYSSVTPAKYCIETAAGEAARLGLTKGKYVFSDTPRM